MLCLQLVCRLAIIISSHRNSNPLLSVSLLMFKILALKRNLVPSVTGPVITIDYNLPVLCYYTITRVTVSMFNVSGIIGTPNDTAAVHDFSPHCLSCDSVCLGALH